MPGSCVEPTTTHRQNHNLVRWRSLRQVAQTWPRDCPVRSIVDHNALAERYVAPSYPSKASPKHRARLLVLGVRRDPIRHKLVQIGLQRRAASYRVVPAPCQEIGRRTCAESGRDQAHSNNKDQFRRRRRYQQPSFVTLSIQGRIFRGILCILGDRTHTFHGCARSRLLLSHRNTEAQVPFPQRKTADGRVLAREDSSQIHLRLGNLIPLNLWYPTFDSPTNVLNCSLFENSEVVKRQKS